MPKSNVFRVSNSKVAVWRKCRYAYFLRYIEKLRRKRKARPLQFGSLVHTMLEADANGQPPFKALTKAAKEQGKLFASEREEFEEIVQDVKFIMTDYFEFWENQPEKLQLTFHKLKGIRAEHEIVLDLVDGIECVVKLDAIGSTGDDRKWLVEHKTFRAMPSEDHRWRNLQSNLYKWALDDQKIQVDGMCWDYIRSKSPSVPKLLKGGNAISEKRLDTLPSTLTAFFKEQGVKSPRMIAAAESNRKNYFTRLFTAFRAPTVKLLLNDFKETAKEMREFHGISKAKTVDRHCDWCEFEPICRAELTGSDAQFIRKKEYEVRDREEKVVQEVG